jgi:hypothetical protein
MQIAAFDDLHIDPPADGTQPGLELRPAQPASAKGLYLFNAHALSAAPSGTRPWVT